MGIGFKNRLAVGATPVPDVFIDTYMAVSYTHLRKRRGIKMPWLAAFLDGIAGKNGICKDFMHMILAQVSGSLVNKRCSRFFERE